MSERTEFRGTELPVLRQEYRRAEKASEQVVRQLLELEKGIGTGKKRAGTGAAERRSLEAARTGREAQTAAEVARILEEEAPQRTEEEERLLTVRRLQKEAGKCGKAKDDAAWKLAAAELEAGLDTEEAMGLLNELANREDTRAIMKFAELFEKGKIYEKDPTKALECLQWAYELKAEGAAAELGRFYRLGIGTEIDRKKAFGYFEKAAGQGNAEAAYQLAAMCFEMQKPEEAVQYLQRSMEAGVSGAAYQYALCLYYGDGIRRDRKKAVQILKQCAREGDQEAADRLQYLRDVSAP
ncbi:MAG: tetratricopeptide repeat protein [Lachnospiraceae bacterium]|nr:tetratricopeptide repeat protein [Lachnospiraceae bacterium]